MLNATTNCQAQKYISKNSSIVQKPNFEIQVAPLGSKQRNEIENFIKQGFSQAYKAKVSITMPHLLALSNGKYKAALGLRSGHNYLFVEQYLSAPIEQQAIFVSKKTKRQDIVEIGHLFSNAQRFTIPLFMVTAVSLFYLNYKYMVFSGTEKVINLIGKSGVPYTFICNANSNKIQLSTDDWGSYYNTNPKVIAVSLLDVMSLITKHPLYQALFQSLDEQIAKTCQKLL